MRASLALFFHIGVLVLQKMVTYAHFTRSGLHDIIRMILALERLLASGNTIREKFIKNFESHGTFCPFSCHG